MSKKRINDSLYRNTRMIKRMVYWIHIVEDLVIRGNYKMAKEKVLTIVKGEEFKLSMKETIEEDDIFYEQYVSAASMLDDIVSSKQNTKDEQADWCKMENENNIIAFCGERGEGKSSTMMTFINVLSKYRNQGSASIFEEHKNIEPDMFSEPVVIDPSVFDKVHNILDVVVANLFKKFSKEYNRNPRRFEDYKREELLSKFQKVYKSVSLLNDPDKMLETEYDGEGSIENISKMGESIRLKEDMKALVKCYLESMSENNKILLVAIDDLDLCNNNVYKMAEQIRKYLIIPNVVIVMALKIEQLEMCVQEENLRNYSNVINSRNKGYEEEIRNMAERYIAKLIPKSRRIYLPNVRYINDARIEYKGKNGKVISREKIGGALNNDVLDFIYSKTGMKFVTNDENYNVLIPDNLRELVNMVSLLAEMQEPGEDDDIYYENIEKFAIYFEREWIVQNCITENYKEIQALTRMPYLQLHAETIYLMQQRAQTTDHKYKIQEVPYKMERENCFFWFLYWQNLYRTRIFGRENEKFAYMFRIMYTIRLAELRRKKRFGELSNFIGGYIWGPTFGKMLPGTWVEGRYFSRSRICMSAVAVYKTVLNMLDDNIEEDFSSNYNVSKIRSDDEKRNVKILAWILVGLFCNTYDTEDGKDASFEETIYMYSQNTIIRDNYVLSYAHVCLENYMVGLCNLGHIYDKVNMKLLGIGRNEFDEIVEKLEKMNANNIEALRKIFTNLDLIINFRDHVDSKKQLKEGGEKDGYTRTKVVVERFLRNIVRFLNQYIGYDEKRRLNIFAIENNQGKQIGINISDLYADLMQTFINDKFNERTMRKRKLMDEIFEKFDTIEFADISQRSVSNYLRNRTVENIRRNMDNLLHNIRSYYKRHPEENIKYLDKSKFISFYAELLDYYLDNPKQVVPESLYEEYKEVVSYYNAIIEE